MSDRSLRAAIPAAAVALACFVVAIALAPDPPPTSRRPSPVVPSHLFQDIAVGTTVAGWRVTAISAEADGGVRIEFARDDVRFAVSVIELGTRDEPPYLTTERHAIYYGHAIPADAHIPDNAVRAVTANVERRVRAGE